MPFYEYQCKSCEHQTEELQKISDPPLTECPACHKNTLEKMVSASGFQLTGSGWYATDFKDKKPQPAKETTESDKTVIADSPPEKTPENKTAEKKVEKKEKKKSD